MKQAYHSVVLNDCCEQRIGEPRKLSESVVARVGKAWSQLSVSARGGSCELLKAFLHTWRGFSCSVHVKVYLWSWVYVFAALIKCCVVGREREREREEDGTGQSKCETPQKEKEAGQGQLIGRVVQYK